MDQPRMVTIKKNLLPDVQVVISKETYGNKIEHKLLSFVKSESVLIEENCSEDGIPDRDSYRGPEYHACRLTDDVIEVCDPKYGWIPADEKLNDEYKSILADKELLGSKSE